MSDVYESRKEKAWEIDLNISPFVDSTLIVGSVAYNPFAVTEDSDLDMIIVCDFKTVNFQSIYKALNVKPDMNALRYAHPLMANVHRVVLPSDDFETELYFWDRTTLENVVKLKRPNRAFVSDNDLGSSFGSQIDVLKDLEGNQKPLLKKRFPVQGGFITYLHNHHEIKGRFYLGMSVNYLLLDPVLLSDKDEFFMNAVVGFEEELRSRIKKAYSDNLSPGLNLCLSNALPEKVQNNITFNLENYLNRFLG